MVKTSDGRSLCKGTIKCTRCSKNLRFSTKSIITLKNHYESVSAVQIFYIFIVKAMSILFDTDASELLVIEHYIVTFKKYLVQKM